MSTWPINKSSTHVSASYGDYGSTKRQNDGSWIFAVTQEEDQRYEILGDVISIASSTIAPGEDTLTVSAKTMARKSDKYLKDAYPEIYIPSNLLMDCVIEAQNQVLYEAQHPEVFGSLFAVGEARDSTTRRKRKNCLIFIQGEPKNKVGLTLLRKTKFELKGFGSPVPIRTIMTRSAYSKSFDLPIQDIQFAVDPFGLSRPIMTLQTANEVYMYRVSYKHHPRRVSLQSSLHLAQDLLRNEVPACTATNPWNDFEAAVISRVGTLSIWQGTRGSHKGEPECLIFEENIIDADNGWLRMIWGSNRLDLIIANSTSVYLFGVESKGMHKIYELTGPNRICNMVVSRTVEATWLFLVTTSEIVWIDIQAPKTPLFAWKHYRANDTSLSLQIHQSGRVFSMFLCSRIVPIVIGFQGSYINGMPQCTASPYLIQIPDTFIASSLFSFSRSLVPGAEAFESDDVGHPLLGFYYMTKDLAIYCVALRKTSTAAPYSTATVNEHSFCATQTAPVMSGVFDDVSEDEESSEEQEYELDDTDMDSWHSFRRSKAHRLADFTLINKEIIRSIHENTSESFETKSVVPEGDSWKGNLVTLYETTSVPAPAIEIAQESIDKVISDLLNDDVELVSLGLDACRVPAMGSQQDDPDIDIWCAESINEQLVKAYIETRSDISISKKTDLMLEACHMAVDICLASTGFSPNTRSSSVEQNSPAVHSLSLLARDAIASNTSIRDLVLDWKEVDSPSSPFPDKSQERLVMSSQPRIPSPMHFQSIPRVVAFDSHASSTSIPEFSMTQPERGVYGTRPLSQKRKTPRKSEGFR